MKQKARDRDTTTTEWRHYKQDSSKGNLFGGKTLFFELQKPIQNGNTEEFLNILERVSSESKLILSDIFDLVSPAGDSLLHEAAYFGNAEVAKLIGHHFPELLMKTNIDGNNPLHVAARSKRSGVIQVILSQYDAHKDQEIITRLTNEHGNTALHEAVDTNYLDGITLLFHADKCVTHYLNKSGQSSLYLAVLKSNKKIVDLLLEDPFPDDKTRLECYGISPLHAAISTKNADLLEKMVAKTSDLMCLRDEHGGTPMHYAASSGYVEGVHILLKESTLAALECNTKGHLPIHLASKSGHVKVVEEFCKQEWVDSRILLNKKGQNILHVAAKHGQDHVVQYLLRNTKFKQLNVNKKDKNGNTPLHLASGNLELDTVISLIQDERIYVNLMNNEGLTARDTVLLKKNTQMDGSKELLNSVLKFVGAKQSDKAKSMLKRLEQPSSGDMLKEKMNTLMLVAILIVTVTFAAGFTLPGGVYSSDDPNPQNRGIPVLVHKTKFQLFVFFNTVAMYSSTSGSFFILVAQLGKYPTSEAFKIANVMVGIALFSMTLAFMFALGLVVNLVPWLDTVTFPIGFIPLGYILFFSWNMTVLSFIILFVTKPILIIGILKRFISMRFQSKQAREEED